MDASVKRVVAGQIEIDGGTQARVKIDEPTVSEYCEALESGAEFPPLEVWFDGTTYWLSDGFHRFLAYQRKGIGLVACVVRRGTKEDAQWAACGANRMHGLKRSNADKRKAVELALAHPKSSKLSDRAIAEHCGVSHTLVAKVRNQVATLPPDSASRVGRDGKKYTAHGLPSRKQQANPEAAPDDEIPPSRPSPVVGSMVVDGLGAAREALASAALDGDTQSVPATVTPVAVPDRVLRETEEIGPDEALRLLNRIAASARKWDDSVAEKADTIQHVESLLRVYRGDEPALVEPAKTALPAKTRRKPDRTASEIEPELLGEWNAIEGVIQVRGEKLNTKRRSALRERCRDEFWLEYWRDALQTVAAVPGLLGENERKWRATIDWFLRPNTVQKLAEGAYDRWGVDKRDSIETAKKSADLYSRLLWGEGTEPEFSFGTEDAA